MIQLLYASPYVLIEIIKHREESNSLLPDAAFQPDPNNQISTCGFPTLTIAFILCS